MLASLALVRRDLATSLMLEAVTREKPKDWFEYVRTEDFTSEDLELQFLLLFGDNVIPGWDIVEQTDHHLEQVGEYLPFIDYDLGLAVLIEWPALVDIPYWRRVTYFRRSPMNHSFLYQGVKPIKH